MKARFFGSFEAVVLVCVVISVIVSCVVAFCVHVATAVMAKAWLFLIASSIFAPIGVLHGFSVLLGYNWLT